VAFIREALALPAPPHLTLYVRNKSRLPSEYLSDPRIAVFQGDLTDSVQVNKAMSGCTAVISVVGDYPSLVAFFLRTKTTPIADTFPRSIFPAMRANGIKRILALSTPSFVVPGETYSWPWYLFLLMPIALVPQGNAEMVAIAKNVATQTDFDWTVFRIPHLTEGPGDAEVVAGFLGPEFKGTGQLTRASQARWLLRELETGDWIGKAPFIANI